MVGEGGRGALVGERGEGRKGGEGVLVGERRVLVGERGEGKRHTWGREGGVEGGMWGG